MVDIVTPAHEAVKVCLGRKKKGLQVPWDPYRVLRGLVVTGEFVCRRVSKAADLVSVKTNASLRPATVKIHLVIVLTWQRISLRPASSIMPRKMRRLLMFQEFIISVLEQSIITSHWRLSLTTSLRFLRSSSLSNLSEGSSTRMTFPDKFLIPISLSFTFANFFCIFYQFVSE